MTEANEFASDLKFVRQVVERRRQSGGMFWIALLWAGIVMVGCLLNDFRPGVAGAYWGIASAAGFVASCVMGFLHARRIGEDDGREGGRQWMHWGTIFVAGGALAAIVAGKGRNVDGVLVGQVMLLIVGTVYFLAGVHLNRRFLVSGAAMMLGAVLVGYVPAYPWTVAGAVISASLVLSFVPGGRRHG